MFLFLFEDLFKLIQSFQSSKEDEVAQIMRDVASEDLSAWPPDEDDVDHRLRRLFDEAAQQLLPRGAPRSTREAENTSKQRKGRKCE